MVTLNLTLARGKVKYFLGIHLTLLDALPLWAETMDMACPKHKFPFKGSAGALAERLGITRQHLSQVLHGHTRPSGRLAFAIEAETRGKIKAKDLICNETRAPLRAL